MTAKSKSIDEMPVVEEENLGVVFEKLSNLHEDVKEIKEDVKNQLVQMQAFLLSNNTEHGEMVNEAKRAHDRIDQMTIKVTLVEKKVEDLLKLAPFLKAEAFLVGGLSLPLIIWLLSIFWKLITHQMVMPNL